MIIIKENLIVYYQSFDSVSSIIYGSIVYFGLGILIDPLNIAEPSFDSPLFLLSKIDDSETGNTFLKIKIALISKIKRSKYIILTKVMALPESSRL